MVVKGEEDVVVVFSETVAEEGHRGGGWVWKGVRGALTEPAEGRERT